MNTPPPRPAPATAHGRAAAAGRQLLRELPGSILIHPLQVNLPRDQVHMLRLTAAGLHHASFLDQRLAARGCDALWLDWEVLAASMQGTQTATPAHYILHVGHCGSTLVSRLLGELGVMPLREPLPLRTLAGLHADLDTARSPWSPATFESRLELLARLFDRGRGARAVKATSFCNDLAVPILAAVPGRRASIVYTGLRPYLANVLAGPASRLDLASAAPLRLRRLACRVGAPVGDLNAMSPGIVAAMTWATETASLAALLDTAGPATVLAVDFDRLLDDVPGSLRRLADHVAPGITDSAIAAAASSPVLARYSKAPEHAYDAELRREVLAEGERLFADEIRAGLGWCRDAAARFPPVARACELFPGPY